MSLDVRVTRSGNEGAEEGRDARSPRRPPMSARARADVDRSRGEHPLASLGLRPSPHAAADGHAASARGAGEVSLWARTSAGVWKRSA
jgi:hypothetical protein